MPIVAHERAGSDNCGKERLSILVPPVAALLYPFALKGFHVSVARIAAGDAGIFVLPWLGAAACLVLAFAVPLLAILAAMSFSESGGPTATQLRAKRTALLAVAAPTLFTFSGVVLLDLHCRRRDIRGGYEIVPPRVPHQYPAAARGGALSLPDRLGLLMAW